MEKDMALYIYALVVFKTYRKKEQLIDRLKNGCAKYREHTVHPSEKNAKDHVRFKSYAKMLKSHLLSMVISNVF